MTSKRDSKAEPKTFREAYAVLSGHAETLREQTEPNIDELLAIVTESMAAYKVCQTRIDAVDKALKEALRDVDGAERPGRPALADPDAASDDDDAEDDVPF